MFTQHRTVWLSVLAPLTALLLACGGDDDGGGIGDGGDTSSGGGAPSGDSLTVPETDSLTVTAIDLPQPGRAVLYAFDAVWVFAFDFDAGTGLYRVDPVSGSVDDLIEVPTVTPAMLEGADAIWLAGRALFRVDPTSGAVEEIAYQSPPDVGFTPIWGIWQDRVFVVADDGKVYEVDTTTGGFSLLVDSGAIDTSTAGFSGQYVWIENVAEPEPLQVERTLIGIDLATGAEVGREEIDAAALRGGAGAIWAVTTLLGSEGPGYIRIDPASGDNAFQRLEFTETPFTISATADADAAWLGYQGFSGGDFVLRIADGMVQRASVTSPFPNVVLGGGSAWLVNSDAPVLERVSP
jgi:hypothetical protein